MYQPLRTLTISRMVSLSLFAFLSVSTGLSSQSEPGQLLFTLSFISSIFSLCFSSSNSRSHRQLGSLSLSNRLRQIARFSGLLSHLNIRHDYARAVEILQKDLKVFSTINKESFKKMALLL